MTAHGVCCHLHFIYIIMNKHIHVALAALATASITIFGSCKKDDDLPEVPQPVVNEPEQITTVELHITNVATNAHWEVTWSDPDGSGGDAPTIDSILLDSGAVYDVEVHFLDESGDAAVDVTAEVREENGEHLICFEPVDLGGALTIVRTDSDGTYEVGLESQWTAGAPASGEIEVILKHQPDGEKDGTCDPGDTDVEVHFELTIK